MTPRQRRLIEAIRDYAQNTLDGKCPDEGCGILSALVNMVDTAVEGQIVGNKGLQVNREAALVEFMLCHDNNNAYAV